jgi:hypothetical protein
MIATALTGAWAAGACGDHHGAGSSGGAADSGGLDGGAVAEGGAADAAGGLDAVTGGDGAGVDGGDAAGDSSGGPTLGGCPLFPPDYPYNQDISQSPLDPGSATYIANLTARAGAIVAEYPGDEYVNIVPASQPDVSVGLASGEAFGFDPSDAFYQSSAATALAPIPGNVVYENSSNPNSDHHMMVLQQGTCRLFELYAWNPSSATSGWEALVTWNLTKDEQLPDGWGSTTAAGTPLLPGVIRYSEVMAGEIRHAVDIVIPGAAIAQYEYVKPAARSGGACGSAYPADGFPYGGRLRLKASYDTSAFTGSATGTSSTRRTSRSCRS